MEFGLRIERLTAIGTGVAVLSAGGYALPVSCRVRGRWVECRVPGWSGLADSPGEVTLVAIEATEPALRWLFIRGPATVVDDPDWAELRPPAAGRISANELYRLLRIEPKRIERIDEARGWGFRETTDL